MNMEIEKYGNGKNVILILTGLGGNVKGYQNKYETIANNLMKNNNDFTVFVATTPHGSWETPKKNLDYIMNFIEESMRFINNDYFIYAMGHSAGGTFLLWHCYQYPRIKRVVATNPVLNVNIHKIKDGTNNFNGDFIKVIIGEKDHAFQLSGLLNKFTKIETIILKDIDHEFKGNLEVFISIPNKYLI